MKELDLELILNNPLIISVIMLFIVIISGVLYLFITNKYMLEYKSVEINDGKRFERYFKISENPISKGKNKPNKK